MVKEELHLVKICYACHKSGFHFGPNLSGISKNRLPGTIAL